MQPTKKTKKKRNFFFHLFICCWLWISKTQHSLLQLVCVFFFFFKLTFSQFDLIRFIRFDSFRFVVVFFFLFICLYCGRCCCQPVLLIQCLFVEKPSAYSLNTFPYMIVYRSMCFLCVCVFRLLPIQIWRKKNTFVLNGVTASTETKKNLWCTSSEAIKKACVSKTRKIKNIHPYMNDIHTRRTQMVLFIQLSEEEAEEKNMEKKSSKK